MCGSPRSAAAAHGAIYKANDLVHMALGGEMMQCGYDPKPDGTYDTPPIAPQMWHSYHIAGNQAFIAALGALFARAEPRRGDYDRRPDPSGGQCLHRSRRAALFTAGVLHAADRPPRRPERHARDSDT